MTELALASDEVDPLIDALGLSDECREKARAYAERADYEHPINRSPTVTAAGTVYIAALLVNEKRTQREIARAADVNEASVRAAYSEIDKYERITARYEVEDDAPEPSETLLSRIRGWMFP